MKKERVLGLFLLALIALGALSFLVSAQTATTQPAGNSAPNIGSAKIDNSTWYGMILVDWLGFGETWALVISSLMVLLIIFSATYDIMMGFGIFHNHIAQGVIAFGIGVIAAVSGAVRAVALLFFTFGAGLGAFSIAVGIIIPFVIFLIMNILFFRLFKGLLAKKTATEIKAGAREAAAAAEGLGKIGAGFKKAGRVAEDS